MDLAGVVWIWLALCGFGWCCVDLAGVVWIWLALCGFGWRCVDLAGVVWIWLALCQVSDVGRGVVVMTSQVDSTSLTFRP